MLNSEKSTNKHLGLETQYMGFNENSIHWTQHASSFWDKLAAKLQSESRDINKFQTCMVVSTWDPLLWQMTLLSWLPV